MLQNCKSPYFVKEHRILVPCGKCLFCRIRARNVWTGRLILERSVHARSCFVTLTYSDDNLPNPPTLVLSDLQKFIKRLRKNSGLKIRYFSCGEYGAQFFRPHYHLILFGIDNVTMIEKSWKLGFVYVAPADDNCIKYVAGYVTKKFSNEKKELYKLGFKPEFHTMSRKPAIATEAIARFAEHAFKQSPYDVLVLFKSSGRYFPFGRVLRNKLRAMVMSEEDVLRVKELNLLKMQHEILEFIKEHDKTKVFRYETEDIDWSRDFLLELYHNTFFDDLEVKERIFNRRNERNLL